MKLTSENIGDILDNSPTKGEVISKDLHANDLWRWGPVISKHTRFEIMDVLTSNREERGLKQFILEEHHLNGQVSIRDITQILKDHVQALSPHELLDLIEMGVSDMETFFLNLQRASDRRGILPSPQEKNTVLNQAFSKSPEEKFHRMMMTFDVKALFNFIYSYGLPIRDYENRMNGDGYKKKQSTNTTERNLEWWSNSDKREMLCQAMRGPRGKRDKSPLENNQDPR